MAYGFYDDKSKAQIYDKGEVDEKVADDISAVIGNIGGTVENVTNILSNRIDDTNSELDDTQLDVALNTSRIDQLVSESHGGQEFRTLLWEDSTGVSSGTISIQDFEPADYDCFEVEFDSGNGNPQLVRLPATGGGLAISDIAYDPTSQTPLGTLGICSMCLTFGTNQVLITNPNEYEYDEAADRIRFGSATVVQVPSMPAVGVVYKIYGIKFGRDYSSEIEDAKISGDGTTYSSLGNSIRGQIDLIDQLISNADDAINQIKMKRNLFHNEWEHGTFRVQNNKIVFVDNDQVCRLKAKAKDFGIAIADLGYEVSFAVYDNDDNFIGNKGFARAVDASEFAGSNYNIVFALRPYSGSISLDDARDHVQFEYTLLNDVNYNSQFVQTHDLDVDIVLHALGDSEISPIETFDEYCYFIGNKLVPRYGLTDVSNGIAKKYAVQVGVEYAVTTSLTANAYGFPAVAYVDANDVLIGYEFIADTSIALQNKAIKVPDNAAYMYVNSRSAQSSLYVRDLSNLNYGLEALYPEISILFIGNSLTQDGIAYLPYLLKTFYPHIKFKFYMWYNGGYTLSQHYQKFTSNTPCSIFSVADNTSSWTNYNNSKTIAQILSEYTFDIVCMQEYFNYKESYGESDLEDWNNCQEYIRNNYAGTNGLEFVELLHAPLRSNVEDVYEITKSGNELILSNTVANDVIVSGTAIYMALATALDNLGDQGHLSPDGTHAQEGLPCLLQAYVSLMWVLDRLSLPVNIYGIDFKMTNEIYNAIHVPGPNLGSGVIEGTDEQNALAQQIAVLAYKEGKRLR